MSVYTKSIHKLNTSNISFIHLWSHDSFRIFEIVYCLVSTSNVNIPLIGNQNIEYERIKKYESQVRLNGLINTKGIVHIDKNNIYDYTFDDVLHL